MLTRSSLTGLVFEPISSLLIKPGWRLIAENRLPTDLNFLLCSGQKSIVERIWVLWVVGFHHNCITRNLYTIYRCNRADWMNCWRINNVEPLSFLNFSTHCSALFSIEQWKQAAESLSFLSQLLFLLLCATEFLHKQNQLQLVFISLKFYILLSYYSFILFYKDDLVSQSLPTAMYLYSIFLRGVHVKLHQTWFTSKVTEVTWNWNSSTCTHRRYQPTFS